MNFNNRFSLTSSVISVEISELWRVLSHVEASESSACCPLRTVSLARARVGGAGHGAGASPPESTLCRPCQGAEFSFTAERRQVGQDLTLFFALLRAGALGGTARVVQTAAAWRVT